MATKDTLFTVAGITTHRGTSPSGVVSERTKVRFGTDMVRVVKMLYNPKKVEDKTLGICLSPIRVDFIELPTPMLKADAVKYMLTNDTFQSAEDQALLSEADESRKPKTPRVPKAPKESRVRVTKSPSLADIASRGKRKVSVEQVLDVVKTPVTE